MEKDDAAMEIVEKGLVAPITATLPEEIWLSNLDHLVARAHTPTVYFYRRPPSAAAGFFSPEILKSALARALVSFYPLAGRLFLADDGRLRIRCTAQGAFFVVARSGSTVDDFGDFAPSDRIRRLLVPSVDAAADGDTPLVMLQSLNAAEMYNKTGFRESIRNQDLEDEKMDIRKMLKDIERLGSSTSSWKERKRLESRNVVALGGKPTKSHRVPLSVAKPMMKSQKKRELRKIEEEKLLGIFTKGHNSSKAEKTRSEDRVLKSTEGYFSKGVLNVKHLLDRRPEKRDDCPSKKIGKHKKGKGKGKSKGRRKRK